MKLLPGLIVLLLMSISGCTLMERPPPKPIAPVVPDDPDDRMDVEALLRYGDIVARASPAERLQECQRLLTISESRANLGVRLHLFLAQLLTDECGDIAKTLEALKAQRPQILDEGTLRLLAYQEQLLARLDGEIEQRRNLERKLRMTHQKVQSTHRQMKTRESEIKQLQDKLDALKSIEQNLGGAQ